jgi:DNA replication protein DnaC
VSFDREPVPSIARANPVVARTVRDFVGRIDEQLDAGRGLWFTGDVGTGKTTLAMLISKSAMEAGRTVAIYSLPRLLGLLRDSYDDSTDYTLTDLIDRLCAVELLHIDDVGAEQTSPWVLEQLYTIVNTRYEDGRSVLVTTNLVTEEAFDQPLREQIGGPDGLAAARDLRRDPAAVRHDHRLERTSTSRAPAPGGFGPGAGTRGLRPAAAAARSGRRERRPRRLSAHAGHRDRRRPVGRRGQGQDRRPAGRAGRTSSSASRAATTRATRSSATARRGSST